MWKKYITPAVIVLVIMTLLGFIANGFSEDLKAKADNQTLQMYIIQQEKRDALKEKAEIERQKAWADKFIIQQKAMDDRFKMQQENMKQLLEILKDK
jgi:hypothetical protein